MNLLMQIKCTQIAIFFLLQLTWIIFTITWILMCLSLGQAFKSKGNKKYHMVRWENVCLPKDNEWPAIINTKIMNESLLMKWIWRLYNAEEYDHCCTLLRNKYLQGTPFILSSSRGGSQFWVGLHKIKDKFKWGALFKVNNGRSTLFWEDILVTEVSMKLLFPKVYDYWGDRSDGEWMLGRRVDLRLQHNIWKGGSSGIGDWVGGGGGGGRGAECAKPTTPKFLSK